MFVDFFFELRKEGVPVALNEWMTLMEGLEKDLAGSSLTGFYYLARAVLVKREAHYDRFDVAFARCFKDVETTPEMVEEALAVFKNLELTYREPPGYTRREKAELPEDYLKELAKHKITFLQRSRSEEETEARPSRPFGMGAKQPGAIRMGGDSMGLSALKVAGERQFKDYRDDLITGVRQFEMALRKLRQLSSRLEGPREELDLEETIDATANNAGMLSLVWDRPRKNTIKLILLLDSVGSMDRHIQTVSKLFTAAHRTTHFKEIKYYYFHNCIYEHIYKTHVLNDANRLPTDEFFRLHNSEYRLIVVGDASMSEPELTRPGGAVAMNEFNKEPGLIWLKRLARHFPYSVWLNPVPKVHWGKEPGHTTVPLIEKVFPMFELNPAGLEQAVNRIRLKNLN
ncbi:MAG: VWA domain-containing protein [Clostridia bacterium]|jgi:uncharacterized protein with von Willebrand factor type A (vWA) domain|nr:VWA domain-containing protein [Clostridia bacterium]